MKAIYCLPEAKDRDLRYVYLISQILEKEFDSLVFGVENINLLNAIEKNKPEYIILTNDQYKQCFSTIEKIDNNCTIITTCDNLVKNKNIKQIIVSKTKFILFNEYYKTDTKKIACDFLTNNKYWTCDMGATEPEHIKLLEPLVYPNNKECSIRLLNCPSLTHVQNVGMANENDMLDLIAGCDTYINISDRYIYDAIMLGKKIINLVNNRWPKSEKKDIIMTKPQFDLPSEVLKKCLKI